ncbi:MAG TPA: ABC transporter ATP-binding protein [Jatrophihabitantaceae bacterium]|jgi:spermidine/putrescine transport system ATP-binding protein|nr:ABC transporter ATP-binding protein [Jatrophihabitantaceae bacterium]
MTSSSEPPSNLATAQNPAQQSGAVSATSSGGPVPAIELVGIAKRFQTRSGSVAAVERVDLVIGEGEFFSLLGPSGCGKTTTLRMIGGFEEPTEGQILLYGRDVVGVPPNHRDVNMVFQSYALFPHMSVAENVAFGLRRKGIGKAEITQRVGEMLELVQLDGKSDRRPRELSGGQQQRVALARALVNRPRALLLDEPLAALDLKLRQAMQLELKRIQREVGITFVFVTHDQNEALTMSDRLVVMNNGLIEQLGSPREVYERPHTRFVAGFIGTSNLIEGKVARLDGTTAVLERGPGETISVPDAVRAGASTGGRLHITVRPEKIILTESEPAPGRCALRGRVAEVVYLGSSTQYAVRLSDGTELSVYVQNSSDSSDIADRDQDVWLSWRPEHTLALADSPTDTTAALGGAA